MKMVLVTVGDSGQASISKKTDIRVFSNLYLRSITVKLAQILANEDGIGDSPR